MDRKVALAAATAVVLTVSAGTAAVAANLGLLSSTADDTVGQLQAARDDGSATRTIVIEEIVPVEGTVVVEGPLPAGRYDDEEYEEYDEDEEHEEHDEDDEDDEDDDEHDEDDEDDDRHDDDD